MTTDPGLLLAFLAATAVFAYAPGPGMVYATAQTLARGRRAGLLAALGIHVGGYVHVVAAALGLAALLEAVPALYAAMKLAGALCLVVIGLRLVFTRPDERYRAPPGRERSAHRAFAESAVVEILNPKTALFFVAFLPQFADPAAAWPIGVQLLVLGAVVNVLFSSADLLCVACAGVLSARLAASAKLQRHLRMLGGTLLVGLGLRLAVQR